MSSRNPIRTDQVSQVMNNAKESVVHDFIQDYRDLAVQIAPIQWRLFFETGATNKNHPAKYLNPICGAAPVQMASFQVQEQIDSWISNRANEFIDCVKGSTLPDTTKKQLYTINRRKMWFSREEIINIDQSTRALARSIMRHVMGKHNRPDLSRLSPRLDVRIATIQKPTKAIHADLWVTLRLPNRGKVLIPLHTNDLFNKRGGQLCSVVQLCTDERDNVTIRLMQDMAKPFADLRAAYEPKIERLGIDFGLATLLATSEGTLFGAGLISDLIRIDKQILGIARHRSRSGEKPRDSKRYRKLISRLRGMLKTRINTALNRIVDIHKPAELIVEKLDFRLPNLSKRMNRLVSNCGRAVFRAKLVDLKDKYGITATEIPSPYTSQECSSCHYVDVRNRKSQSKFACRWCGNAMHADVNAARVITQRRSLGLDSKWVGKGAIRNMLVNRHITRYRQSLGPAADPRLSNVYFVDWVVGARMSESHILVCAR